LKHYHLKSVWEEFICRPAKQQILEEALTLMAQWFQPTEDLSYSDIETKLDNIAQEVIENLKIKCPSHPILSASHEQFSYWRCNNIDESQWDDKDVKEALNILCEVKFGFLFEYDNESIHFPEYYLINHVSYIL